MIRLFSALLLCASGQSFTIDRDWIEGSQSDGHLFDGLKPADVRKPLILTPYIEKGLIQEGQKAAKVEGILEGLVSYSGYFTVNESLGRNLFFWYFPAEEKPETSPVLIWLQGGPGSSSMYGLATEHGPFQLHPDGTISSRPYRWTKNNHVIYVDSPYGTGFSFPEPTDPIGEQEIGNDLFQALEQFFQLFPHLQKNDFFVSVESYGGYYVPSTAHAIHSQNPHGKVKINLKGLIIGNGMIDENNCIAGSPSDYMTQIGLDNVLSGPIDSYNYLQNTLDDERVTLSVNEFFNRDAVQTKIHVGVVNYAMENENVSSAVWGGNDGFTATPVVEELLENYPVLYYYGQVDTVCPYPPSEEVIFRFKWSGSPEFQQAKRHQWKLGDDLAGYVRSGGNLTLVMVRNAGHMVPADQPKWALELITKFVKNQLS